jgi:eukaryotic-like serine/threonine-protein kinase
MVADGRNAVKPLRATDPPSVGEFRLLGRLGAGGMGEVFLGVTRSGRPVAVKVIRAEVAADPAFRARFVREVAAAREVGGFWTASVVAADPDAGSPWLATEYVPGRSLHEAVAEHGPLPPAAVRVVGARLA